MTFGNACDLDRGDRLAVRGQQRETLIYQAVYGTEFTYFLIPALVREAPVLNESGRHLGSTTKRFELF